jgi:hypothetical protein
MTGTFFQVFPKRRALFKLAPQTLAILLIVRKRNAYGKDEGEMAMDVFASMLNGDAADALPVAETARPGLLERFGQWWDFVDDRDCQRNLEYDPLVDAALPMALQGAVNLCHRARFPIVPFTGDGYSSLPTSFAQEPF